MLLRRTFSVRSHKTRSGVCRKASRSRSRSALAKAALTALTALLVSAALAVGCGTAGVVTDDAARVAEELGSPDATAPEIATTVPPPTATVVPAPTPITIAPTPTPLPIQTRTMLFSGDVLSHTPVMAQARRYGNGTELEYDYRPMFAGIRDRVARSDLAICVLETPVSADNIGLDGYPTFEAPRELPDALVDAGYDGCSTASNHSFDRGADGVVATLEQMDRVGLAHAGMARDEAEAAVPRIYDLDGVAVAHLSYTYSLNGFVLPSDRPWLVNLNDVPMIVAEAERARSGGADLVVLSIQWGNEYQRAPSSEQLALADALTASGALDLIIGNHVHVVQPVAVVNGVPVVYGLGNSLSNQSDNCCRTGTQDGVIIEATVRGNTTEGYTVAGLAFAPTWVDRSNYTIIDLIAALDDPALDPAERRLYQASFDRTVEAVHSLGTEIPLAS